ncbi:PH domain-containing protein [Tunicatimonas pelagia]|uniref:PH domain-containing protein n=1 Tax=Tunicatimonas pelagia TaxID=931531 RepID=UPI002665BFE2|nr:PH domain-containing protein [Tunicatimonas pelagia]WKN44250.1 PH domain-containing protein [Tunicatimonas pelagia]
MQTNILWQDRPSPLMYLGLYLSCVLLLPIPFALWRYLQARATRYTLTTERLICQQGVLHRISDEVELYRIKDYTIVSPFFYRWFGLSDLVLITSDQTHPTLVLRGITDAHTVRELIRRQVENLRTQKGVREID